MSYATQQMVEGYLRRSLTDEEAVLFPLLAAGLDDYIDIYCARTFLASRAASFNIDNTVGDLSSNPFQTFDGGDVEIFFDQPLQADTTKQGVIAPYIGSYNPSTSSFNLLDKSSYVLYPTNNKTKTSATTTIGVFPYGINNIFVYGTFTDYVTPPKAIELAATTLAGNYYNSNTDLKSETIEGYTYLQNLEPNPLVTKLLDNYRRVVL